MKTDGTFYKQFKRENTDFSQETFQCSEDTLSKLLETPTSSEHPGMLLGKVQSGKTRTFISTLILSFDNSFDIVIILSKNSKALIEQTYKRLNKDFESFIENKEIEIYDIMKAPESFNKFELESKFVFVAKKQDHNLERLISLFKDNEIMRKKRVLIIDDEADNASVGYKKVADILIANEMAAKISILRSLIPKISFLQVTATPYSLYLQPYEIKAQKSKKTSDKHPDFSKFEPMRPAFTSLVPVPDEYVGGDTYFGEKSREENTIEYLLHQRIDHSEFNILRKENLDFFNSENLLTTTIINGYRQATISFIVGGCIQRFNGLAQGKNNRKLLYSFLVHSESGKTAHDWQEKLINGIIDKLKLEALNDSEIFRCLINTSYEDLSKSLILDKQNVPNFEDVIEQVKIALTEGYITVTKVNSEQNVINMLDDTGQLKLRSPLHIFIGGQVLDRGITLSNLIAFYYGRRPSKYQQDTVLQHSRMYGYRRSLLAVTRFYTSPRIRSAMQKMEEFDSALRKSIEDGSDKSVQFISTSTDGKIVPCNPNKTLISDIQILKTNTRLLPIGFTAPKKKGKYNITPVITALDSKVEELIGFNADQPKLISLEMAIQILREIEKTLTFDINEAEPFNWDMACASLIYLSNQSKGDSKGKVWLWAANNRNSSRKASIGSHSTFIETPDSSKTEGVIANQFAEENPILFLLRQNGKKEKGWDENPFYWPVIRAQKKVQTVIFASDTNK